MTVTVDKSAFAELVDSFVAMRYLWLIFGILVVIIVTCKMLEKR